MRDIQYHITSHNLAGHYFDVRLKLARPQAQGQILRLPAWIPGSYMIRDFARNVLDIRASNADGPVELEQVDKSSWRLPQGEGAVEVSYRVYAWDLSVRGAHLDTTHGFFNATSVFLEAIGQSDQPCSVTIERPPHAAAANWRLATTLPRADDGQGRFEFGEFCAANYQELIDHPVEMGGFEQFDFIAGGIRHDVVLSGRFRCDNERLKRDLGLVCQQQIDLFGAPPPMDNYLFLVLVVGDGYGGLEHRSSTALICSRKDLPQPGQSEMSEQYRQFLGLCSHEYFHSWNVKRIKPAVYDNPDLSAEVYTSLLWAFEGITSYYDDLALVRCGCISAQDYLLLLAQIITRVSRTHGRKRQSVADSSFNAWTRFYKQDENASNAIVSYYAKGSLVALCLDLKIRQVTGGARSLDDVMRSLWNDFLETGCGIGDDDIQQCVNRICGQSLDGFMRDMIYGTAELPMQDLLKGVGVELKMRPAAGPQDKGGKDETKLPKASLQATFVEQDGWPRVQSVVEDGVAQQAGLSAGDSLVAINGLRADMASPGSLAMLHEPGSRHRLTVFRRDELMEFELVLAAPTPDTAVLTICDPDNAGLCAWIWTGKDNA
jgi:predicted metalloprotease with PDZ domain